jgi:lactate dehydrogenase-like 2-hydroxyacid dehydrogenase
MAATEKHHVVCLEGCHCPVPTFDFPHTYTEHHNTVPADVLARIRDASIVITTIVPITPAVAAQCPRLRLVAVMGTGCGWVEHESLRALGITVINAPQSNVPAVSEHAIMLYLSARRRLLELHSATVGSNEWAAKGTLTTRFVGGAPRSCAEEDFVIIGYGALGRKIESLARGMGVENVLIAERRGVARADVRPGRVALSEAIVKASVLVICCPKEASTINLIGESELMAMRKDAVLVNIARGGIVNEVALVKALKEGWISGAATDVFEEEPPLLGESPLLPKDGDGIPGLTVTPHISWYTDLTLKTLALILKSGVENWVDGKYDKCSLIVDGRSGERGG